MTPTLLRWTAAVTLAVLCGCARSRPNVILVTLDTTRADAMGYATGRENVTPNLDKLAASGTWFSTCVSSQPLTVPAHSTIMTGLYPYRHGVRNNGTYILDPKHVTLAEQFKQQGYTTHAIVSSFVLDSQFGLDQGFDTYDDDLSGGPQQKMFMFREIRGDQTANKAVAWLQKDRDKPFFLWLHFFDPHADYEAPAEIADRFPGERYLAEVAFMDRELGRVLKALEEKGVRKNTIVAVAGDHGESLGDHGERSHGIFVYDSTVRVPLLFTGRGIPEGRRVDSLVRSADIAPTLLALTRSPSQPVDGSSLLPLMRGDADPPRSAYSEVFAPRLNFGWSELRSVRTAEGKYIDAPRPEYYDVRSDGAEARNLFTNPSAPPEGARPLIAAVRSAARTDPFSTGQNQEAKLDSETRRKLAALGYITTGAETKNTGPRPDPKDRIVYWEQFQEAQAAIRRQDYTRALAMVRSVLSVDKDNIVAMSSLANVLAKTNQRGAALEIYKRMIQIDPERDTGYLGASRVLRETGQFEEAELNARTVIRLQPENPEAYAATGDVLLEQNRFEEAEKLYRQAIALDPHSSVAISGLGNCLNRAGRLRDALAVLREGHQHDPTSQSILYNLAVVVERLGDTDGAKKLYEKSIALDPDHSMTWNNLGAIHDRAGNINEAIRCVGKARQADPSNLEAAYNFGVLLMRANRPEQALASLTDALRLRPTFAPAALQRARLLTAMDRKEEALKAWRPLTAVNPAAWLQIARIELALGNEPAARAAVREGIQRGGEKMREAALSDERLRALVPSATRRS